MCRCLPPSLRPSPVTRRVGVRVSTFEACSSFTRVTARWLAQPPKAAFVTRLRSRQSPSKTARQLPELSTTPCVEPSSTGDARRRGARITVTRAYFPFCGAPEPSRRPTAPSTSWMPKLPKPRGGQGRASWRAASDGLRPLTASRLRKEEASMRKDGAPCRTPRARQKGNEGVSSYSPAALGRDPSSVGLRPTPSPARGEGNAP